MLLSFRQGIVQHETTGFLHVTSSSVSLIVDDTPTTVTISGGSKDYLHIEKVSVADAWMPVTPAVDQWLYWDISTSTGARTFGITLLDPVLSAQAPVPPVVDQHWFDTTAEMMKVWNGARWVEKLRVFACKLSNGAIPVSMSPLAPSFIGTQALLNESSYTGQIMFDSITGKVLKTGTQFVTSEDVLILQTQSNSDVKFASLVIDAESQQALDAYTIVKFSDFRKIVHADAFTSSQPGAYGIIQQSCQPGDVVTVQPSGAVTNPNWDWTSAGINAPIYCDSAGVLTSTRQTPGQFPVATVIDAKTILMGTPSTIVTGNVTVDASTLDELLDVTITTPTATQVLAYNGTLWVNSTIPAPATNLDALTDVTITTPADNQVLTYNGTVWVNEALPAMVTDLDALTDVVITGPVNNQVLTYNGTAWVNEAPATPTVSPTTINTQTGNYVIQLSDAANTMIRMTSATANTVTIPDDITADLPVGATILIGQSGAGQTTIVAGAGVTVVSPTTLRIGTRYGKVTAIKVAANSWEIEGNLAL
jgi:hypothetical protein